MLKLIVIMVTIVQTAAYSPDPVVDPQDIDLLAKIVYLESANQSFQGKLAVANVIVNRMESEEFPDSLEDVIFQPGQFSPADEIDEMVILYPDAFEECRLAADQALDGVNNIGQALYFLNPDCSNPIRVKWFRSNLKYIGTIGDHEFYGSQ